MKRFLSLISLVMVLVIALTFISCTQQAPATTPSKAPTSTQAPAAPPPASSAAAQPIKLFYATWAPPSDTWAIVAQEWGKELEQRTNGKVKVEYSYGSALGKTEEYYDFVLKGMCDMANLSVGATPGRFPITDLGSLPWSYPTSMIGTKAWLEVFKKGYMDKEYGSAKVTYIAMNPVDPLMTASKKVTTLDAVKGLKLRIASDPYKARVEAMGAVPVYIPLPEAYAAMQKGTIDGTITVWVVLDTMKLADVVKYATLPASGNIPSTTVMNKDYYNKLPKDVQTVVDDLFVKYSLRAAEVQDGLTEQGKKALLAKGGEIVNWDPAAWTKMKELFKPLWDKAITDTTAKGVQAKPAIEDFIAELDKLGVKDSAIGYVK